MYSEEYLKNIIKLFFEEYRDKEAFVVYRGKELCSISFLKLGQDILKAAGFLKQNKIERKHIALGAKNSYEWYIVFFAALLTGNTAVLLDANLPAEEILYRAGYADTDYIFCEDNTAEIFKGDTITCLSREDFLEAESISSDEIYSWKKDELMCLLFTSGTLGTNKAVMLSAGNMQICMSGLMDKFEVERTLLVLPLYHIGGIGGTLYLLAGGKTVCIGRGIKYFFQDLPKMNPNHILMVPGIMNNLVRIMKNHPDKEERKKYIGANLRCLGVGGAVSEEEVCRYLIREGFHLSTGYGLSETAGIGMMGMMTEDRLKSIGQIEEGMKCRIENGEILLSGDAVMLGYYKDPEATRKAVRDGWLYTGDLGYQDKDGWYYLTGRKKNVIILSNGENVSPEQLEETLYQSEAIKECMVYSVPKGICADVYTDDQKAAKQYIEEYNQSVPTYRQIFRVNYSEIPLEKTGSGKIKRKENRYE